MILKKRTVCDESGAETVEFALALPILLVVAVAAIQLCLMGFQVVAVEKQAVSGAWSVSASEIMESNDPEGVMKSAICDGGVLDGGSVEITNMEITTETTAKDGTLSGQTVYARVNGVWKPAYTVSGSKNGVKYTGGGGAGSGTASSGAFTDYIADRGTCSVSCDVTYTLADILSIPGLNSFKVTRHIECTLIDHNRAEVK